MHTPNRKKPGSQNLETVTKIVEQRVTDLFFKIVAIGIGDNIKSKQAILARFKNLVYGSCSLQIKKWTTKSSVQKKTFRLEKLQKSKVKILTCTPEQKPRACGDALAKETWERV
jgi:hypothetical protein